MHVSVTTLGATAGDLNRAAGQIVGYLEGNQPGQPNRRNLPGSRAPDTTPIASALEREGGPGGYYADAAEVPGRWRGAGTHADAYDLGTVVDAEQFRRVLLGQDPHTGERLIETRHQPGTQATSRQPSNSEALTSAEAAEQLGVSASYIQRLVKRTAEIRAEQAAADRAGTPGPDLPATYLDATKTRRPMDDRSRRARTVRPPARRTQDRHGLRRHLVGPQVRVDALRRRRRHPPRPHRPRHRRTPFRQA